MALILELGAITPLQKERAQQDDVLKGAPTPQTVFYIGHLLIIIAILNSGLTCVLDAVLDSYRLERPTEATVS